MARKGRGSDRKTRMAVHEFCLFHNEGAALEIKRREAARWVDRLTLCQATRTFRNAPRPLVELPQDALLHPVTFKAEGQFEAAYAWGPSRRFPFWRKRKRARQNEARQRNFVHQALADVADDDIVVLSDVDEIIDARRAGEVIAAAREHGVVSVRLHHTLFYLNLYSRNWDAVWPGSPPDYAHRVFVMTGAYFRAMRETSDSLRQLGEGGRLIGKVPLVEGFCGFHHSWLGGEEAALAKIRSYAHSFDEHRADLVNADGSLNEARLRACVKAGESIFPGHELEIRSFAQQPPLQSVAEMRGELAELVL